MNEWMACVDLRFRKTERVESVFSGTIGECLFSINNPNEILCKFVKSLEGTAKGNISN
jgi:hypothetical protein